MRRSTPYAAIAALLLTAGLAGCSDADDQPTDGSSGEPSPTTSQSPSTSGSPSVSASTSTAPAPGGTTTPSPVDAPLAWTQVPGSVDDVVTGNGRWTISVDKSGRRADLSGPAKVSGYRATGSGSVSDALMDEDWAVVVRQDPEGKRPEVAQVVNLDSRRTFTIDGSSDVPTTPSGTWALGQDTIAYATMSRGAYCLATFSLESGQATVGYCAPPRTGFSSAHITDEGLSLLTFDDAQPSCRTLVTVTGTTATPYDGPADCKGVEGLLLDDGDTVWAEVPNPNRYDSSHVYARTDGATLDLGASTTGTLIDCGDDAYFVRPAATDTAPAQLMQWDGTTLTTVFESESGPAFLSAPRCGDETLTLTSFADGGDQQVTVPVD